MQKIGIVAIDKTPEPSLASLLRVNESDVIEIRDKSQLRQLDGVIIRSEEQFNFRVVCEWILTVQESPQTFIWVFTPKCSEKEKEIYLQLGANGVVVGSNSVTELKLLVNNSLIRLHPQQNSNNSGSKEKKLILNELNMSVILENGKEVSLTRLEFQTMLLLYEQANSTVTYESLHQALWKEEGTEAEKYKVANIVFRLREKIAIEGVSPIQTVRSKGYRLTV